MLGAVSGVLAGLISKATGLPYRPQSCSEIGNLFLPGFLKLLTVWFPHFSLAWNQKPLTIQSFTAPLPSLYHQ